MINCNKNFLITFRNCIPNQSFKKVARVIYNMFEGVYQKKKFRIDRATYKHNTVFKNIFIKLEEHIRFTHQYISMF